MAFPCLTVFMILIIIFALRRRQLDKRQDEKIENFLRKEDQANHTPSKDISTIDFLSVPLDRFPIGKWPDDEIGIIEEQIEALSKERMLNLTGKTNTEIKLEYGTNNLDVMSEIGDRFNDLSVLLVDYAKALMEKKDYDSASTVLEYGVSVGTDISENYTLLGDCYVSLDQKEKIPVLKEQAIRRHLLLEHKILTYLDGLMA